MPQNAKKKYKLVVFLNSYPSAHRHAWRHRMPLSLSVLLLRFEVILPLFYYYNLSMYDQNNTTIAIGL